MLQPADIEARAAEISEMIEARLGPGGPDLMRQMRKLGRRVPKAVRSDLDILARATSMAEHPKLFRQIDPQGLSEAHKRLKSWLSGIDPGERRLTAFLHMTGGLAFNLLVLGGLVVVFLRWRGLV